ncbi:hypothetical protein [Cryobacterium sp. Y50]|uniref:hypothetical protein n=1 Tax=Cryobacterium sp. Y50 TaxID=2048286 RepID=UPI001E3E3965|nr:hypothetical protein [Cryobacterium sp. Y50]
MSAPSSVSAVPFDSAVVGEALAVMRGHALLVQCLRNVAAVRAPRTGSLLEGHAPGQDLAHHHPAGR